MISHMSHIDENAKIGKNCKFGHNVIIGQNVTIGDNNFFGNNIVIEGNVDIGSGNYFSDFITIGRPGQHRTKKLEFQKTQTGLIKIGNDNIFREFITIHLSVEKETKIGNNCSFFDYVHLPHDVQINDNVVLANDCQLGGLAFVGKCSYLGFANTVHPRSTIGAYCMIGMQSIVSRDIPPFLLAYGSPIRSAKVNIKGLEENGFTNDEIKEIVEFYKILESKEDFSQNIPNLSSERIRSNLQEFLVHSTRNLSLP